MKASIYVRTSTEEQFPEKQIQECKDYAYRKGYEIEGIYEEKLSGYKDIQRPKYEILKEKAKRSETNAVIVWALDRWVRNRDTLIEDIATLKNYGCKLHSVKESYLEAINIEGALGKTIHEFLIGLIGSMAEVESARKSDRIKMAFKSHQGKQWGRPDVPAASNNQIIELYKQGKSMRQIRDIVYYYTQTKLKRYVSLGHVQKTIKKFKSKKVENTEVHQ